MGTTRDYIPIIRRAISDSGEPGQVDDLSDDEILDTEFSAFGFDSMSYVDFCVSIHVDTGIELTLRQVAELGTPRNVLEYLRKAS